MRSWRTLTYAFLVEMMFKGRWESEVGTRRFSHAVELAQGYPEHTKIRIIRCYDGEVMWTSDGDKS